MIPDRLKDGAKLARDLITRWGELGRAEKIDGFEGMDFDTLDDESKACLIEAVRELVTRPLFDHELDTINTRPTPPLFQEYEAQPPPEPSRMYDCYICGRQQTNILPGRPCFSCSRIP